MSLNAVRNSSYEPWSLVRGWSLRLTEIQTSATSTAFRIPLIRLQNLQNYTAFGIAFPATPFPWFQYVSTIIRLSYMEQSLYWNYNSKVFTNANHMEY
jgi:hypothetical protein